MEFEFIVLIKNLMSISWNEELTLMRPKRRGTPKLEREKRRQNLLLILVNYISSGGLRVFLQL